MKWDEGRRRIRRGEEGGSGEMLGFGGAGMLIATSMVGFLLWRSERGPPFDDCVIPCVDSLIR